MPAPQEVEAAKQWATYSHEASMIPGDAWARSCVKHLKTLLEALTEAERQLEKWSRYLKTYPNAREVNKHIKDLERQLEEARKERYQALVEADRYDKLRIMAEIEKAKAREEGARMRERLEYIRSAYCDDLDTAKEFADKALRSGAGQGGEG